MRKFLSTYPCGQAGYSLVGVSLFLVVFGILVAGGMGLKQKYDWAKRQEVTIANTTVVKNALKRYQAMTGRLPCPSSLTEPPSSPTFGRATDCSAGVVPGVFEDNGRNNQAIRYGAIPVHTLNLPGDTIVDGWGNRYIYAVTQYYTVGTPSLSQDQGGILIVGENDETMTKERGNVIFAVVSPGPDERGAYTMDGVLITGCDGASTNCLDENSDKDGRLTVNLFKKYNTQTNNADDNFSATMMYTASSESYEWRAGPWSACGCNRPKTRTIGRCDIRFGGAIVTVTTTDGTRPSCIAGTSYRGSQSCCDNPRMTRTVSCFIKDTNTVVNDNMCANSIKPNISQRCAQFCWGGPDYPRCPGGCGRSPSVVRAPASSLECFENNSKSVVFGLCNPDIKPVLAKWCPGTPPCPPPPSDPGGGWIDTNGDGLGDTHIRDMPNGTSGPSSSTPGGRVDGNSNKDSSGTYGGNHDSGDTGWKPVSR